MSAKSRDSADSLDSEIVFDLSDEVKLRWIQFISVKLTVAPAHYYYREVLRVDRPLLMIFSEI